MLLFLPIMLCCSAHKFHLLCSILCSCEDLCLGIQTVLLEYNIKQNINMVTVLLEYIDLWYSHT